MRNKRRVLYMAALRAISQSFKCIFQLFPSLTRAPFSDLPVLQERFSAISQSYKSAFYRLASLTRAFFSNTHTLQTKRTRQHTHMSNMCV